MAERTFSKQWWPIHVAVAWIVTRDEDWVDVAGSVANSIRDLQAWQGRNGRTLRNANPDDGWLALRDSVGGGTVKARGEDRTWTEEPSRPSPRYYSAYDAAEFAYLGKLIPAAEFAISELRQTNGDDYVVITKSHPMGRPDVPLLNGYQDVRVFRDDLLRAFPSGDPDLESTLNWQLVPHRAASRWAARRVERFSESQRLKRDWIRFGEIADWCSELGGSVVPDEGARASAYDKLESDVLAGIFEEAGRSCVLFMHPAGVTAKMTRRRYRVALQLYDAQRVRAAYSAHCWIPRRIFDRWLDIHNLPMSPRFKAVPPAVVQVKASDESAAIRALAVKLQSDPDLKHGDGFKWCRREGFDLSEKGFRYRIWPNARLKAGLSPKARPGRKPKSSL